MRIGGINNNIDSYDSMIQNVNNKIQIPQNESAAVSGNEKKREKETKDILDKMKEMENMRRDMLAQLENARQQGDAMSESIKVRTKCLLIAMRIICGDTVPVEDYRYLAENDMELYGRAIIMRREKENPEEHGRISEDEDSSDDGNTTNDSSGGRIVQRRGGSNQAEINTEAESGSQTSE